MNSPAPRTLNPLVNLLATFLLLLPVAASPVGAIPPADRNADPAPQLDRSFGQLPLYFVENRGQTDPQVAYSLLGGGAQVYFGADGLTFALPERTSTPSTVGTVHVGASHVRAIHESPLRSTDPAPQRRWVVKLDFVGANPAARIEGEEPQPAVVSYFKGSPDEWQTGLPTYTRVAYHDLWPGIDLAYYGSAGQLKYDFVVHPGADPAQIRLRYRGAESVTLNAAGQVVVSTPLGGFTDDAPVAWQAAGGGRTAVSAAYSFSPLPAGRGAGGEGRTFGFDVGAYDPTQPLVIDPVVLLYCGYIGGSGDDSGEDIAVDGAGNAYVTGQTLSTQDTFPVLVGPDLSKSGDWDAFVAKVSPAGTALVYAGYIGGSNADEGHSIAVDGSGNAYVTGQTRSMQDTFPVLVGPDLTINDRYGFCCGDAFVAKVNPSGTALIYAGYIGGSESDYGEGIAVDGTGNAYVAGYTGSAEDSFPVTGGPDLSFNGGFYDAYVAKVNAPGTALVYAGYIGGGGSDTGYDIAVDGAGNAYVVGGTVSDETTFPVTGGPDLSFNGGNYDAYVAKVSSSGTALVYAGYIGGSGSDHGTGIAVDSSGNAYVVGSTGSAEDSFPVTGGPDLIYNGGYFADAFVAKMSPAGTALVYAGYIGGSSDDWGQEIAVDDAGNAYVTGSTGSTEDGFPVAGGLDLTHNGGSDAYVAKVNSSGTVLVYAGYIGGSGGDGGRGIAVDGSGNAYVVGSTGSAEDSFPVTGGPDLTYNGGEHDAFVAKVSSGEEPLTPTPTATATHTPTATATRPAPTQGLYLPLVLR